MGWVEIPFHFSKCVQGRGGRRTLLPAGLQIKLGLCSLRADFQEEKKRERKHVVTLKTTRKGIQGGFIIDQFTWRQQRGLNPLRTKRPTGKALSLPRALPHAPISAFCSTQNCVFTSIVANGWGHQKPASPVSDSAGEPVGGELGAPALRSGALSGLWLAHSPLSKECKPHGAGKIGCD